MTRYTPLWLQNGSYAASVDRRLVGALWPAGAVTGCAVSPSTAMTLNIAAGQVAVPSQNNTGSTLCSSDAIEQVTLATAPGSGTNRYDLVICQPRGNDLDGGANDDWIFSTVTGTAATTPAVPAVPAGALALAQVYVPGGSASVTAGNITDVRPYSLAVPPTPLLAYKQVALANYTTTSGAFVFVNNANARVGPFIVPPSGRVLLSACSMWTSAGGGLGSIAWSDIANASAYVCAGQQLAGAAAGLGTARVDVVSNALTPGTQRTLGLVWGVTAVAGTIGCGGAHTDLTLTVTAL
jgi:hypothetical protein